LEPNKGRLEGIEPIGAVVAWGKDDDGTLSDKDIERGAQLNKKSSSNNGNNGGSVLIEIFRS
jgi:hypothetical protein